MAFRLLFMKTKLVREK